MAIHWRGAALAASSVALAGCAVVQSRPSSAPAGDGVAYMLPMALLPVELVESGGALMLAVQEPRIVGDPAARYLMSRSGNAFSSDNVQVSVSNLGLLESVKVTAEDKTIPALIKIATARATPEAADVGEPTVLYRALVDPTQSGEIEAVNTAINKAAKAFLKTRAATCTAADEACAALKALHTQVGGVQSPFSLAVQPPANPPVAGGKTEAATADCSKGICYRVNQPYRLTLTGLDTSNTVLASIPNGSPTLSLPLERWAFVKTSHDVTLQAGVLKSVTTDRPSSALALASAPVEAASAVLTAAAEIIQLKVDLSQKETALANARIAEIKAKSDLETALIGKSGAKQVESAAFGAPTRQNDIVSVTIGSRNQFSALSNLRRAGLSSSEPELRDPRPGVDGARERAQPGSPGQR